MVSHRGALILLLRIASNCFDCLTTNSLFSHDSLIADRYLIDHIPQIDIAAELGCERSTISRRVKYIIPRVSETTKKLNN